MTYAELIKAARICANQTCCDNCPRYDIDHTQDAQRCCIQLINDAADALEAAEKRIAELMPKEGEWITADNPPKNEGLYLVGLSVGWDNEYVVRLARYTKDLSEALFSSKLSGDGWYRWDGDNDCDVICHPEYWMELPEPPNCGARMRGEHDEQ